MPQRQTKTSFFEDAMDILISVMETLPTWAGPTVAAVAYVVVRFLGAMMFSPTEAAIDLNAMIYPAMPYVAGLVAALVLVAWVAAEGRKYSNRVNRDWMFRDDEWRGAASRPGSTPTLVPASPPAPRCPRCESLMVTRTARRGLNPGSQFWGCERYPACLGTRSLDTCSDRSD